MKYQIIGGFTVSLLLAGASFCAPKGARKTPAASEMQITVRIHDYARANPSVLVQAENAVDDILHQASVATLWIECPTHSFDSGEAACSSPVSPVTFVVNLLPRSMSDRLHLRGGVLGFALEGTGNDFGFTASVFYDVVKDCAAQSQPDFGQLLGDAIAHELGHLLLGTNSHSSRGLMSAFWSGRELRIADERGLAFLDAEVKRIQAAMTARTIAATASAEAREASPIGRGEEPSSARAQHVTRD